jgi:hypothetical protein
MRCGHTVDAKPRCRMLRIRFRMLRIRFRMLRYCLSSGQHGA